MNRHGPQNRHRLPAERAFSSLLELFELDLKDKRGDLHMPFWVHKYTDLATNLWLTATPVDYLKISTIVIVLGWAVSRRFR